MSPYIGTGVSHSPANGTTGAARTQEAVAHARQHLDYQRRVALTNLHRHDPRMMTADEWARRIDGKRLPLGGYGFGVHTRKDDR